MTDEPTKKTISFDAYTVVDAMVDGLTVLLGGIAVFNLPLEYSGPAALILVTLITMGKKLLGKSSQSTIEELSTNVKITLAQNSILRSDAKPTVIRDAEAAGEAVRTTAPPVTTP